MTMNNPDEPLQEELLGGRRQTERKRRQRARRIALLAGALILLIALIIPVTGYYVVFVRPLQGTALTVNDSSYSWDEYLTRTRMLIAEAQASGTWQPESLNSLIFDMIDELERQEIIKQYAPSEGVSVTQEEIDREVRGRILGRAGIDDPDITESEFRERYRRRLELLKIGEGQFEEVSRVALLSRKLEDILKSQIPAKVMQRHLFVIQVQTLVEAREALDRIDGGESFSDVARDISRDSQTSDLGGDLGWVPEGIKEEYDTDIFTLEDGEISVPLFTQAGVVLIMAVGEPELRDVRETHQSRLEAGALSDWLRTRRQELVEVEALSRPNGGITNERYTWILDQLQQDRELFPRRTVSG